jgi:hypothetical protein
MNNLATKMIACFFPAISAAGFILNGLTFAIYSRERFKNTIFSTYFRYLLFNDSLALLIAIDIFMYDVFNINLSTISHITCKLEEYFIYLVPTISAYISVAISVDRFMSVAYPMDFQLRKKPTFQLLICLALTLLNYVFYIEYPIFDEYYEYTELDNITNTSTIYSECYSSLDNRLLDWLDLFNSTLIPFLLLLIFTGLTIRLLFNSRKRANSIISASGKSKSRDQKFARISIATNLVFFLFNMPICLSSLVDSDGVIDEELFENIALFIFYSSFASQFFISMFVNSLFRKEFFNLIRFK